MLWPAYLQISDFLGKKQSIMKILKNKAPKENYDFVPVTWNTANFCSLVTVYKTDFNI